MSTSIPLNVLSLKGQRVNKIEHDENLQQVIIHCKRDKRRVPIDSSSGLKETVNQTIQRQARDLPFMGLPCVINIELAQGKYATLNPVTLLTKVAVIQKGFANWSVVSESANTGIDSVNTRNKTERKAVRKLAVIVTPSMSLINCFIKITQIKNLPD